jgi:hypothetical protein
MDHLFLEEVSVAPALLPATNAEVQTTSHETVSEMLAHSGRLYQVNSLFQARLRR